MWFWWIRKWFIKRNPEKNLKQDELNFMKTVEIYSEYSTDTEFIRLENVEDLINLYRNNTTSSEIFPTTNYNNKVYIMFDLDELSKYNDFCKNIGQKYAVFQSSPGHYWAFIDKDFKSISEFYTDPLLNDWKVYSDKKYDKLINSINFFPIRGIFNKLERQPELIYQSDDLSKDFSDFINKLNDYFQTTSLELSMLKYRDIDMLKLYKRKKKLERILK